VLYISVGRASTRAVRGEDLVGLASKEEVAVLEEEVQLFATHFIETGHHPSAELEALGRILSRPAGRLHHAIMEMAPTIIFRIGHAPLLSLGRAKRHSRFDRATVI
jgi:hypothetical protein